MLLYHLNQHHRIMGVEYLGALHFVQQHEVAAQVLHVTAAVVAAAALPIVVACFAIPIQLELA